MSLRRSVGALLGLMWLGAMLAPPALLHAQSSDLVVIVNQSSKVTKLNATQLYDIFTSARRTWSDGQRVMGFNMPPRSQARTQFDRAVLQREPEQVARFWVDQRVRGGARAPRSVSKASLILRLVETAKGAIGYVPESSIKERKVRVVARIVGKEVKAP